MKTIKEKADKDLLLEDLFQRLPYGVKVTTTNPAVKIGVISGISIKNKISVETKNADIVFDCTEVKPYLCPMSSMTEDEKRELLKYGAVVRLENAEVADVSCTGFDRHAEVQDWLNAHHFDFRNLIEKGLAIEVTEENNPYKE